MKRERKIFSGRSNPELAKKIAISADCQLGDISIKTFSDGEIWVKYEENVRGQDVFIIQSTNGPSENIMNSSDDRCCCRASASTVNIICLTLVMGGKTEKINQECRFHQG